LGGQCLTGDAFRHVLLPFNGVNGSSFQAFQGKELTAEWLFIASYVACSLFCY